MDKTAGFVPRWAAYMLDSFIAFPLNLLCILLFPDNPLLIIAGTITLNWLVYIGFLCSAWQATPGKYLLHLYVTDAEGRPLHFGQASERYFAHLLPFLPFYSSLSFPLNMIVMFWLLLLWYFPISLTPQHTGLHDILCKTRVRKGRPNLGGKT